MAINCAHMLYMIRLRCT